MHHPVKWVVEFEKKKEGVELEREGKAGALSRSAGTRGRAQRPTGGGASIMIMLTTQCDNSPAKGALKGRFDAKKPEKGRIPSRPISWTMRPWLKMTERTFPKAEIATKADNARSALVPNTFRKKEAAMPLPELRISSRGTAAK